MISCCNNNRLVSVTDPSGVWNIESLIGSTVHIKSVSISTGFFGGSSGTDYTIEKIQFRISLDGKCFTIISLKELPGKTFTWKDLEIVRLYNTSNSPSVCGMCLCGTAICGITYGYDDVEIEGPTDKKACCDSCEGEVLDD